MSSLFELQVISCPDLDATHQGRIYTDSPLLFEAFERESGPQVYVELVGPARSCAAILPARPTYSSRNLLELDGFKLQTLGLRSGSVVRLRFIAPRPAKTVDLLIPPEMSRGELGRFVGKPLIKGEVTAAFAVTGEARPIQIAETEPDGVVIIGGGTEVRVEAGQTENLGIRYSDIGGLEREIRQVRETVEYPLRFPELFERLGASQPRGVILHGPPGTGKTLIARAVAGEAGARIFTISGPEIYSKWYGDSEERLRQLFEEAQRAAPAIILIDELDALVPKRDASRGELEQRIVASVLTLMDGLHAMKGVVVLGTTNRINSIDPALRREGRFSAEVHVGVPDVGGRRKILEIYARRMPLASGVDLDLVALRTVGYVGADLVALCREAAYCALRETCRAEGDDSWSCVNAEKLQVTQDDFLTALATVRPSAMREFMVELPDVTWDDIGGLDDVKRVLIENIAYGISRLDSFRKAGVEPVRGILLYGPPGTGKTLLAKAVARECGANFIAVRGPELRSKWFGESEERVRAIMGKAREVAPCVVFFDEIDAVAPARGGDASGLTDSIVNQLLAEMDGVQSAEGVFILGATNRPDMLDEALLRPGRLEFQVEIPLPDLRSREAILRVHLCGKPLEPDVDIEELVQLSDGCSGADIAAICRQGGMRALRRAGFGTEGISITMKDLRDSLEHIRESASKLKPRPIGFSRESKPPEEVAG